MPDDLCNVPEWIVKTQSTLGNLIKRPIMTTKLLWRPPFRFIFDIVAEVARETGFMMNVLSDPEMDLVTNPDKQKKLRFLAKVISEITNQLGVSSIDVSPSKIVAGLEPEKTNNLLVALYDATRLHIKKADYDLEPQFDLSDSDPQGEQDHSDIATSVKTISRAAASIAQSLLPQLRREMEKEAIDFNEKRKEALSRLKDIRTEIK